MGGYTVPAVLGDAVLPALPLTSSRCTSSSTARSRTTRPTRSSRRTSSTCSAQGRRGGADLGLAFDGDADRCFVVDAAGDAGLAERDHRAGRDPRAGQGTPAATVIHNLITSHAVPEIVREHGGVPVRTRVGHSFIKAEMARTDAVFGGEHSAHYYFRDFWFADTGMLAAMHVLAALGEQPTARWPSSPPSTPATSPRARSTRPSTTEAARVAAVRAAFAERDQQRRRAGRADRRAAPTRRGSTSARPTPSRCCGSTSRARTRRRWPRCATRRWRRSAQLDGDPRPSTRRYDGPRRRPARAARLPERRPRAAARANAWPPTCWCAPSAPRTFPISDGIPVLLLDEATPGPERVCGSASAAMSVRRGAARRRLTTPAEQRDEQRLLWSLATAGAQVRRAVETVGDFGVERLRGGDLPRALLVATDAAPSSASRLITRLSLHAHPGAHLARRRAAALGRPGRRAADRLGRRPAPAPGRARRAGRAARAGDGRRRARRPARSPPRPAGRRCTSCRATCTRAPPAGRC